MKKINMGKIPVPMKTVHHASRNIQRGKDAIKEGNTAGQHRDKRQERLGQTQQLQRHPLGSKWLKLPATMIKMSCTMKLNLIQFSDQ